ncbi:MAG: hypothetical protein Q3988_01315 [Gemella sp.]|nr:hypothetical protein [Gemella sp.]
MKKLKIIFISIFSLLIFLPLIFFNFKSNVVSEIDNRKLKEFPNLSNFSADTFKDIYSYFDDRYGGRELAVNSYVEMNDKVFGELVHPVYTYGKDGHVFFFLADEKKYTDYHKDFLESISRMRDYVESQGGQFYLMINPEKKSVYKEYLPQGFNYNRKWIEEFERGLDSKEIKYIDTTNLLREKSKTQDVYNKKYDAGHWNDWGAYHGLNGLLKMISKDFSTVREVDLSNFEVKNKVETSLKVSKFPINEDTPDFVLKNPQNYEDFSKQYKDLKLDKNYPTFSYTKNKLEQAKPRALVYQGSYLNGREKFMKTSFSEYIAIHNYQNVFDMKEHYTKFKPDIVIFEVAEYTFAENYFSREKMKKFNKE